MESLGFNAHFITVPPSNKPLAYGQDVQVNSTFVQSLVRSLCSVFRMPLMWIQDRVWATDMQCRKDEEVVLSSHWLST